MKIIEGGRDHLERELLLEIFKPAENREKLAEMRRQLSPRGEPRLVPPIDLVPAIPKPEKESS